VTRTLAAILLGICLGVLLVPRLSSSHTPPGGTTARIHHGSTALLWLDRHHKGIPRPLLRRSRASHEWLLMDGLRRKGVLPGLMCIKSGRLANGQRVGSGEGGWETNTGNGYYGGLQADLSFQKAYGLVYYLRWDTANNWPRWAQLHMGYRGWLARGFYPWPRTARACGLI
jgi:hypothetical protein